MNNKIPNFLNKSGISGSQVLPMKQDCYIKLDIKKYAHFRRIDPYLY